MTRDSTYLFFLSCLAALLAVLAVAARDAGLAVFCFAGAAVGFGGGVWLRNQGK